MSKKFNGKLVERMKSELSSSVATDIHRNSIFSYPQQEYIGENVVLLHFRYRLAGQEDHLTVAVQSDGEYEASEGDLSNIDSYLGRKYSWRYQSEADEVIEWVRGLAHDAAAEFLQGCVYCTVCREWLPDMHDGKCLSCDKELDN